MTRAVLRFGSRCRFGGLGVGARSRPAPRSWEQSSEGSSESKELNERVRRVGLTRRGFGLGERERRVESGKRATVQPLGAGWVAPTAGWHDKAHLEASVSPRRTLRCPESRGERLSCRFEGASAPARARSLRRPSTGRTARPRAACPDASWGLISSDGVRARSRRLFGAAEMHSASAVCEGGGRCCNGGRNPRPVVAHSSGPVGGGASRSQRTSVLRDRREGAPRRAVGDLGLDPSSRSEWPMGRRRRTRVGLDSSSAAQGR